jgi:hypothetical protein
MEDSMNKMPDLYENTSELADAELDAITGGGEMVCNGKGECKFAPNGADVWNAFSFASGVGVYIK